MPNDARFWAAAGQAPQQAASRIRKGPLTGTKLALGWGRRGRRKRVGAQRCCAPTQQYSQLGATYLRPVIARLARIRRLAPVRRNGRRGGVRRGRRTIAMRRHGRRGARRGSGRVGIPGTILASLSADFWVGGVVAFCIDLPGVDGLAAARGG